MRDSMSSTDDETRTDDQGSQIVPFDPNRKDYKEFEYSKLHDLKKNIRLLKLLPGKHANPDVECELFEAEIGDDGVYHKSSDSRGERKKINYEALSWCWPTGGSGHQVLIRNKEDELQRKRASGELVWALKYLRDTRKKRILWIDAICIDQANTSERNHQVENMAEIYSFASQVCVWLGKEDNSSRLAFKFIKNEIMQLQNFDELCANDKNATKWQSLLSLMQRRWFSRRWVVQEIALSHKAIIYCGPDEIAWKDFAVAVELFVEVETATHRLSEVMQKDPKFYHVPGWFEYVSELGASLLVQATGTVFRDSKAHDPMGKKVVDISSRRPLLSLEYLVSTLSTFDVTEPRDVIYSLLAIAKDTTPYALDETAEDLHGKTQKALEDYTERKRYVVDYKRSYPEVCKDFIEFCMKTSEPSRALDIICRPWAPEPKPYLNPQTGKSESVASLPSWVPQLTGASFAMFETSGVRALKITRKNADTLVGIPMLGQRNYNAAQTRGVDHESLTWRDRSGMRDDPHFSMYVKGFILDEITDITSASQNGAIPEEWLGLAGWNALVDDDAEPPPEFWRTLVADRGRDGRNPPVYYEKACKESVIKGGVGSGAVNTSDLIHNERNSIIAQFCRRVQAVIWNRSLIKTKGKNLGIASKHVRVGDKICILYGCSVPVILRQCIRPKTQEQVNAEKHYDKKQLLNKALAAGERRHQRQEERKKRYEEKCRDFPDWRGIIQDCLHAEKARQEIERDERVSTEMEDWLRMQFGKGFPMGQELRNPRRSQTQPTDPKPANASGPQQGRLGPSPQDSEFMPPNERNDVNGSHNEEINDERRRLRREDSLRRFNLRHEASKKRKETVDHWLEDHRAGPKRIRTTKKSTQASMGDENLYYTFLGECYIHGMMDGEAMGYFNNEGLHSKVFELR